MNIPLPRFFRGSWVLKDMINLPKVPKRKHMLERNWSTWIWGETPEIQVREDSVHVTENGEERRKKQTKRKAAMGISLTYFYR